MVEEANEQNANNSNVHQSDSLDDRMRKGNEADHREQSMGRYPPPHPYAHHPFYNPSHAYGYLPPPPPPYYRNPEEYVEGSSAEGPSVAPEYYDVQSSYPRREYYPPPPPQHYYDRYYNVPPPQKTSGKKRKRSPETYSALKRSRGYRTYEPGNSHKSLKSEKSVHARCNTVHRKVEELHALTGYDMVCITLNQASVVDSKDPIRVQAYGPEATQLVMENFDLIQETTSKLHAEYILKLGNIINERKLLHAKKKSRDEYFQEGGNDDGYEEESL